MAINGVVKAGKPESEQLAKTSITMADIEGVKRGAIEQMLTMSPAEFAALFGKKVDWALARMRDGSVEVLDEQAKVTADGNKFSRFAVITMESVRAYRESVKVPVSNQ
jgi:hypothetical protein